MLIMTANENKTFSVVMCNKSSLALKAFALHALREAEVFLFLIFLCLFFVGFNILFFIFAPS